MASDNFKLKIEYLGRAGLGVKRVLQRWKILAKTWHAPSIFWKWLLRIIVHKSVAEKIYVACQNLAFRPDTYPMLLFWFFHINVILGTGSGLHIRNIDTRSWNLQDSAITHTLSLSVIARWLHVLVRVSGSTSMCMEWISYRWSYRLKTSGAVYYNLSTIIHRSLLGNLRVLCSWFAW